MDDRDGDSTTKDSLRDREATTHALIEAAIELFAERGPNEVSVREIARHAGVNHGLVHHYFGSKSGLVAAVLDHLTRTTAADIVNRAPRLDQPFFLEPEGHLHMRVLARVVLDGAAPPGYQTEFPLVDRVARIAHELFGLDPEIARLRAVQAIGMLLGWLLFEPWLLSAGGFEASETEALRSKLLEAMVLLAAPSPPPTS